MLMRANNPSNERLKHVWADLPNIAILTKIPMPEDVQVMFCPIIFVNKSLGETVTAFFLVGSSESMMFVAINTKRAFTSTGDKIRLTVM